MLELPSNILKTVKYKDIVVDCYCGSGTTCLVAKNFGVNYIGFDISSEYCGLSRKRLESAKSTAISINLPETAQNEGNYEIVKDMSDIDEIS